MRVRVCVRVYVCMCVYVCTSLCGGVVWCVALFGVFVSAVVCCFVLTLASSQPLHCVAAGDLFVTGNLRRQTDWPREQATEVGETRLTRLAAIFTCNWFAIPCFSFLWRVSH